MEIKKYNFGILGCGHIAQAFCIALNGLQMPIKAVASRELEKAELFKKEYRAEKAYGSYLEMLEDKNVEIVYIATPHGLHYEHLKLCIAHHKNIICEKAFTLNEKQAKEILDLAKKEKVLVMEAMWTRFLPAIKYLKDFCQNKIIKSVSASFGFLGSLEAESRLLNKRLGGGAILDIGIYPITIANILLGKPQQILCKAKLSQTGVDIEDKIDFLYGNNIKAHICCSFLRTLSNKTTITFSDNKKIIIPLFWKANKVGK
ncbi:MAG: Gfo/Idh/MocA family oxidoreductase, partial [Bacillales bacterium]|nr:Gfo/Idh/MocA family oxidoreductase [Bacillales bacterium]